MESVTDEQILEVARKILGSTPLKIERLGSRVLLVADRPIRTWAVRVSFIRPDHLAFDRVD